MWAKPWKFLTLVLKALRASARLMSTGSVDQYVYARTGRLLSQRVLVTGQAIISLLPRRVALAE